MVHQEQSLQDPEDLLSDRGKVCLSCFSVLIDSHIPVWKLRLRTTTQNVIIVDVNGSLHVVCQNNFLLPLVIIEKERSFGIMC